MLEHSCAFHIQVSMEEEVSSTLLDCQVSLPRPVKGSPHHHQNKSSEDNQLRILHDLIQGNIQRSRLSIEQLDEAKTSMLKVSNIVFIVLLIEGK